METTHNRMDELYGDLPPPSETEAAAKQVQGKRVADADDHDASAVKKQKSDSKNASRGDSSRSRKISLQETITRLEKALSKPKPKFLKACSVLRKLIESLDDASDLRQCFSLLAQAFERQSLVESKDTRQSLSQMLGSAMVKACSLFAGFHRTDKSTGREVYTAATAMAASLAYANNFDRGIVH